MLPARSLRITIVLALLSSMFAFFTPTPSATALPPTCAQGGVCLPGDIGPGGGLVFYVSSTPFKCGPNNADDCLYLEAAPRTWGGGATDPLLWWNLNSDIVGGISRDGSANMATDQLGLGYKNSRLMAAMDSSETNSAVATRAYSGGSKNDWYLPTIAELGILCQYAHGQTPTVGNTCDYNQALNTGIPSSYEFSASSYQSSSQSDNRINAQWHQNFVSSADGNPAQQSTYEYASTRFSTRPIRAFTTVPTVADGNVNCGGGGGTFAILNKEVISSTPNCSGAVSIPYGVTAVGYAAFWQRAITSVSIPNTVRSLGDSSFRQTSMTFVSIPASVETIGFLTFGTTFLTSLTFATNSNLTTIGPDAFQSSRFTSVTIPASVTTIDSTAFLGNPNLVNITFNGIIPTGWPWSAPSSGTLSGRVACGTQGYFVIQSYVVIGRNNCRGSVVIPSGVTAIADQAFDASPDWVGVGYYGNYDNSTIPTQITSLTIPNTVTTIGEYAFRNLAVTSLTIPNSVTSMGIWTFAGSSLVDSLTISSGITTIPAYAFAGLTNLRSLEIPSRVTTIESEAFNYIAQLETLTIPSSVTSLGASTFSQSQAVTTFNYCGNLTSQNFTTAGAGYLYGLQTCGVSAPGAPTNVSAAITGIGAASVSFTAPSSNGGAVIFSYTATSSPGGFTRTLNQEGSGTFAFTGLETGTTYSFSVTASNWGRTSSSSISSNSVTTPGVPGAPTGVTVTLNDQTAVISFTAPVSDGGSTITSYTASASRGGFSATVNQSGSGTISILSLTRGETFQFSVVATNALGNSLASEITTAVTTPGVPNAPTGVRAVLIDSVTATVSFTAPSSNGGAVIDSYTVISTPDNITASVIGAAGASITVTGLTAGTNYIFRVFASNSFGDSVLSAGSDEFNNSQPGPLRTTSVADPIQKSKIDTITASSVEQRTNLKILGSFVEQVKNIQLNGINLAQGTWTQTLTFITLTLSSLKPDKYEIQIYNGASPALKPQTFSIAGKSQPAVTNVKVRRKLITCVKGFNQKLVYSVNPVCPVGFKKK